MSEVVKSPRGISPPGAPRTVREPLNSYGSRWPIRSAPLRRAPLRLVLEIEMPERLPGVVADDEAGVVRLIDRPGGGKRRMGVMIAPFPLCAESDAQPTRGGASLRADFVAEVGAERMITLTLHTPNEAATLAHGL